MSLPMPSDFAIRLACGLATLSWIVPSKLVPPAFFRTHCLVMLGLFVMAALFEGRAVPEVATAATVAAAALAFVASVAWGVGLIRIGAMLSAAIAALAATLLIWGSWGPAPGIAALNAAGALASALLMGATLTAMLLGHYYLTAPMMSIDPLRKSVAWMAGALGARTVLALAGLAVWYGSTGGSGATISPLFLGMRWGMGIAGPILATVLAWKTVAIRSTQSATGILYIGMTLVLFGELTAIVLTRRAGVLF